MSDIKRYGVWDKPPREDLVTYADHEAAIEQAYSDGESSGAADWQLKIIEVIERHDTGGIMSPDAEGIMGDLRALTQPQTEIEGKPDGTWYDIPDGGGAATAAGAFDPDPLANPDCQECGNDDAGCLACGADANWDS